MLAVVMGQLGCQLQRLQPDRIVHMVDVNERAISNLRKKMRKVTGFKMYESMKVMV